MSDPWVRRVWSRHRQLFLAQVGMKNILGLKNILKLAVCRSLSGCPRANKPKSRHKDGAESEPLRLGRKQFLFKLN